MRKVSTFILLHVETQLSQYHLLKRPFLLNSVSSFAKKLKKQRLQVSFWPLSYVELFYMFLLIPVPYVWKLVIASPSVSTVVALHKVLKLGHVNLPPLFLFSILFGLFRASCNSIWVLQSACSFLQKGHWILIGIADCFGEYYHL